jgi:hypothetical protein
MRSQCTSDTSVAARHIGNTPVYKCAQLPQIGGVQHSLALPGTLRGVADDQAYCLKRHQMFVEAGPAHFDMLRKRTNGARPFSGEDSQDSHLRPIPQERDSSLNLLWEAGLN